ncbi:flagellar motor switch protein FliN [Paenarthrobacter sp. DKR-5]|uniref:flagellar motor switch protein FliN n=1 Tax=Paenarthrobacter sp. DKR-5 TaxID=2835535 RepID=UPI001BDD6F00|nr:flagellar motor switch protein FliN [Paenarthrobacter sp. DKR-5]MBT1002809.1 flagellar motor switch protein FliN [Paenarthrobacter sp. DKR-5]
MSTNTALHNSAVSALTEQLPTPVPFGSAVLADRASVAGKVGQAVTATFVGALSADLAVALVDTTVLSAAAGTDSPLVSSADVLRPALEAAAAVLGAGVLGESRTEDAFALFNDPGTVVFELISAGSTAGWFALRIREQGTVKGSSPSAAGMSSLASGKLSRIHNVEMALTVAIGHTRLSVRDVLDLEPGGVIELDRSAGAPADVLLNGRLIAHGEVVVVDQDYAVRITKILDVVEGVG